MSNNKNQKFNEILICKICEKYYLNPVILPCGNNICKEHVNENNSQSYECNLCNDNHELPETGFIINQTLIDMMNLNMHLDERTRTLNDLFNDLDLINNKIDSIENDPEDFVYSYFSNEINKIDLKRETFILKVNEISDEMIKKVKQMETDSISSCSSKYRYDYERLTQQLLEWKEEIENPDLNR